MRHTFCVLLCSALTLGAQHTHTPSASEKPVSLYPGLGTYSHRINTSNPEAQKYFDQGLALLYGFNRYEALRSFRKAAELDPKAVMPLWGIAAALAPHINMDMDGDVDLKEGCAALTRANPLSLNATEYERGYLESAASRCPEYKPEAYGNAMRQIYQRYPDDLDAATLYAESLMIPVRWRWFQADGQPAGQMDEAIRILEQVMRRDRNHPGANHFYIHAVEMSPSPERAIPSAIRLMGVVPAAGHLVHMPGHIWLALGEWETAAAVNEQAARADRNYFATTGVQGGYAGYYLHNLHFIVYARAMQGRAANAIAAADFLAAESRPALETMAEMADCFIPYNILARVRFHRWNEILAAPKPAEKLLSTTALWHWARAQAYNAQGNAAGAQQEAKSFDEVKARVPAEWPWLNNKARAALDLAGEVLQARLATSNADAISHWRRAVEMQDQLVYDEPPPWYMPLRESLGAALLRSGNATEAEQVFREGLRRLPRNGRMLFGLHAALDAQNRKDAAELVKREFDREWKGADTMLRMADF